MYDHAPSFWGIGYFINVFLVVSGNVMPVPVPVTCKICAGVCDLGCIPASAAVREMDSPTFGNPVFSGVPVPVSRCV